MVAAVLPKFLDFLSSVNWLKDGGGDVLVTGLAGSFLSEVKAKGISS